MTVGAVLQLILVGSIPLLVVGRFILGGGVGIISNAVPLYLRSGATLSLSVLLELLTDLVVLLQ